MSHIPIRTTVVGSYPFPGWLEFASKNLHQFGAADVEEMIEDAVIAAVHDQVAAGLDVITDGEQTRFDFNLSFMDLYKAFRITKRRPENLDRRHMTSGVKIISWVS